MKSKQNGSFVDSPRGASPVSCPRVRSLSADGVGVARMVAGGAGLAPHTPQNKKASIHVG